MTSSARASSNGGTATAALPLTASIAAIANGSPLPTQSGRSPALLDNLVGARQHQLRHSEAERLGGLEIDDQLENCRLLDWQIGGLGALEDFSRVSAEQAKGSSDA